MNRKKRVYEYSRLDSQFCDSPLNPLILGAFAGLVAAALWGCL